MNTEARTLKRFRSGSAVDKLHKGLMDLAHGSRPHAKLPTARELCATYGASSTSLNSVLRDLEAQDVIYRKHGHGIFVSPNIQRKSIGIFLSASFFAPVSISPFWGLLWGWCTQEVQRRSQTHDEVFTYNLIADSSSSEEPFSDPILRAVWGQKVDGVLAIGLDIWHYEFLARNGVGSVGFGGPGDVMVDMDNDNFLAQAASELAARGCRRIGLWKPCLPLRPLTSAWVLEYPLAPILADLGLEHFPALQRNFEQRVFESGHPTHLTNQMQGRQTALEVFGHGGSQPRVEDLPDGLIITDDMMTDGALATLEQLGIQVGKDVRIVTHSNAGSPILFGRTGGLIVLEYDPEEIVRAIFAQLDGLLRGDPCLQEVVTVRPRFVRA